MSVFVFFLLALLSEVVGTIGGFGSSVFFVPLAGFFFDFHTVLALTSILHAEICCRQVHHKIRWSNSAGFARTSAPTSANLAVEGTEVIRRILCHLIRFNGRSDLV